MSFEGQVEDVEDSSELRTPAKSLETEAADVGEGSER
jgi:hypothetical protein